VSRGSVSIFVATGVISAVTAATRLGQLPARSLAATPAALADGRVWLLVTSAIVADRPAAASILGFLAVGLAAVALCGARVTWLAAAAGHILSALTIYVGLGIVRAFDASAYERVLHLPDFGTSAIIAAWLGAVAYTLWQRRARAVAVLLVTVSALIGWYCKGALTVLDTEHAVALAVGVAAMRYLPDAGLFRRLPRLAGPLPRPNHSSSA
jgi:hypothetical protein